MSADPNTTDDHALIAACSEGTFKLIKPFKAKLAATKESKRGSIEEQIAALKADWLEAVQPSLNRIKTRQQATFNAHRSACIAAMETRHAQP